MKSCIVLSGQYRTFDQTWPKIKEFIDLNELDVYCHLWSTDETEIKNVTDRLNPKNIMVEDSSSYDKMFADMEKNILLTNPKTPSQIWDPSRDKISGNASMNYGRKAGLNLVPKDVYDYVVYCRYDIGFKRMFNFDGSIDRIITPLEESYNLISDIFAIIPMAMVKGYFLYDEYERLHSTDFEPEFVEWLRNIKMYPERDIQVHRYHKYCPHSSLLRNIIMKGTNFYITDLPIYLQR